jgi:predicted 2-oxoglutarate/Fe(II)-dependent dioxygenase YbiX
MNSTIPHKHELDGDDVFVLHHFLSRDDCAHLIARSETLGYEDAPITTGYGSVMAKGVRNNARVMVDDPELAAALWARARDFLPERIGGWEAAGFNERFRFYRYDVAEKFAPHYDGYYQRDNGERSQLTFMVYLNEGAEGGETVFSYRNGLIRFQVRPVCGMALVFKHLQLHEGAPVERGRKYVLRTDVMYRRKRSEVR